MGLYTTNKGPYIKIITLFKPETIKLQPILGHIALQNVNENIN